MRNIPAATVVAMLLLGTVGLGAANGPRNNPTNPPAVVVESVVARVNNAIITNVDLDHAKEQLLAEAQGEQNPPSAQELQQAQKDLLRDLINKRLLLQRASDLGYSAETETIQRLDDIRRNLHLPTMDDLQKAVESQGQDYEEFKQQIKDGILQQMVIEQDVAPRITVGPPEVDKYYQEHKSQFVSQAGVDLSEILISTKGTPASDAAHLKAMADQVRARAARGEDFVKLAGRYSAGTTANSGGEIGFFKQGTLAPALEKVVFNLPVGGVTPVMTTPSGYLILRVNSVRHAGQETLDEARNDIQQRLYEQKLQPELRDYLARLRSQAYLKIAAGYVDTGASDTEGVNLERFERVLPQDLPKPVAKPGDNGGGGIGGPQ